MNDPRKSIRPSDHEQETLRHGQAMIAIWNEAMNQAKASLGKGAGLIKLGTLQLRLAQEIAIQQGYSRFDPSLIRAATDLMRKIQDAERWRP